MIAFRVTKPGRLEAFIADSVADLAATLGPELEIADPGDAFHIEVVEIAPAVLYALPDFEGF